MTKGLLIEVGAGTICRDRKQKSPKSDDSRGDKTTNKFLGFLGDEIMQSIRLDLILGNLHYYYQLCNTYKISSNHRNYTFKNINEL